jgi:hypothetical protein
LRAKIELADYEFNGKKGVSCKVKSVQIASVVEFSSSDEGFGALESEEMDSGEPQGSEQSDAKYDF